VPLVHVLGSVADPAFPGVGLVALNRGPTIEDAFPEIAGEYSARIGTGSRRFKIKPDGRFAWTERDCWIDHREFGYVKRRGEEIEFVPIPKPGEKIHQVVTQRYRTVEWGKCLYLSIADDRALEGFCREALFPNRPSHSTETYESYLRQSDRDNDSKGLPRVPPEVWVKFLANETSLNNEEGSLKTALDFLLQKTLRKEPASTAADQH
jgi:hypothetical protein